MATRRTKRITLELPADLYERLLAVAGDEKRELRAQLVVVVERAVKLHEGRKRSQEHRRAMRSYIRDINERYG
jgi:metal-responsive CopG/Arc/MetJ family transcriptional regulator